MTRQVTSHELPRSAALQPEDLDPETAGLGHESAGRLRLHRDHDREQAAHDEAQREARRAEAERLAGLIADHPDLFLGPLVCLLRDWLAEALRRAFTGRTRG
jgi:hypothetical protein